MKLKINHLFLVLMTGFLACNTGNKESNVNNITTIDTLKSKSEKVIYDNRRESLKLSVVDTIKTTNSYFFSNPNSKDLFQVSINPGLVKNSKATLKIITIDGKIIYSQSFDAYYFIKWIFEPDTVPHNISQVEYDKYLVNYWRSLTPKQYEIYFKKSVNKFFDAISFINREKHKDLNALGEDITETDFLAEVNVDPSIKLVDISCFDCDEGGAIIGYSRKQNKVVTLLEHD